MPNSKKRCRDCREKDPEKAEYISFNHLGVTIRIFKEGSICRDCAISAWKKLFNFCRGGVTIEKGVPQVDWTKYSSLSRESDAKDTITLVLVDLGVLSFSNENCWDIVADGPIGLNPRAVQSYVFFARQADAVEYAQINYANTLYCWEIRHVDKVVKKKDIISKSV